jgi:L-lactate dehydrogenase
VLTIVTAGINERAGGATDRSDPAGRLKLLDANAKVYRDIAKLMPRAILLGGLDEPLDLPVGKVFTAALANCYIGPR